MSYIVPNAEYMLINAASKTAMDCTGIAKPGNVVYGWSLNINIGADNASNQVWRVKYVKTDEKNLNWYTLTARRTGYNLELPKKEAPEGTQLVTKDADGGDLQLWAFRPAGDSTQTGLQTYVISNRGAYLYDNTFRNIDMHSGDPANKNPVNISKEVVPVGRNQNMVWLLVKAD